MCVLAPVRQGLIVCFLQVLFLAQNRLEMSEILREERSNMCRHDEAGVLGNGPKSELPVMRTPG